MKEKKTVSFKFSPNQIASFVGEQNVDKINDLIKPDTSPIEVGNFRQVEVILENDGEFEKSPGGTIKENYYAYNNIGSPGVIFRKKRDLPQEGLQFKMMPMINKPKPINRKKYFNQTNPKLQTRFDSKFSKIR